MPNQRPFSFDLRRLRPKGRGRSVILKGIALSLLFVFALQLSRQYWTFTLLVAGVAMGWWGLSTYRRKRQRQEEILSEIKGMGKRTLSSMWPISCRARDIEYSLREGLRDRSFC